MMMTQQLESLRKLTPAFALLALLSCSEGDAGSSSPLGNGALPGSGGNQSSGGNQGNGTAASPYGPDAAVYWDAAGITSGTGADTAPATNATDCLPFSPPIVCAAGTACPGDAYCDFKQSPPICTKLHCLPNGAACPIDGNSGNAHCTSGICLSGVCTGPTGEGASCASVPCASGLHCLGYPPRCMTLQPIGGPCQDMSWCAQSSTETLYCLSGVCGLSNCRATGARSSCASVACDPGYGCVGSTCVQLYCGKDGMPCDADAHCATGYGCVRETNCANGNCVSLAGSCRQLNVAPHCAGTPSSAVCPLTEVSYTVVPGCVFTRPNCSGTAFPCDRFSANQKGCAGHVGCQWDSSTNKCTGTPTPCNQLTGPVSLSACIPTYGCTGAVAVIGSPTPCDQLSTTDCASQPGCKVTDIGIH